MSRLPRRDFLIAAAGSVVAPNALHELLKLLGKEDLTLEQVASLAAQIDQINPSALRAILAGPAVVFELDESEHPDGAIRPGQPLSFRWGVHDWRVSGAPVEGKTGEDPRFANATAALIFNNDTDAPVWRGQNRTPNILASRLPREFYRLGRLHYLQLQVRLTPTSSPLIARPTIRVVADEPPNWMWPVGEQVYQWKESYTMHGRIRNNARFSRMTVQPVLNVNTGSEPPEIHATTYTLPAIPVALGSAPVEAAFGPPIAWTWSEWAWFHRVLFTLTGNTSRVFRYTVSFIATDDYDNAYPEITTSPRDVVVYVAPSKTAALLTAFSIQLDAAAALIVAGACVLAGAPYGIAVAAWWVGVASTLETVAQVFAAIALDPPELDMRYMESIPLPQKVDPKQDPKAAAGTQSSSLAEFAAYARRIGEIPLMMSIVQGKLMGAYAAQDKASIEQQTGSYVKALQAMLSDTEALMKLVPAIKKELSVITLDSKLYEQSAQSLSKGFSPQVSQELEKAGISKDDHQRLQMAMQDQDILKQAMNLSAAVEKTADAIAQLTIEVRDESVKALRPPKKKVKQA